MKASELRIGNLVRAKSAEMSTFQEPVKVCITYLEMFCRPNSAVHFEPIPLTLDWLINLGIRKANNQLWISMTNLKAELHFEVHSKEIVTIIKSDYADLILDPLKYVHQLQNLYFALAGEELTIKPKDDEG